MHQHTSDISRGAPFNEREEVSEEFVAGGVTIEAGRFEIDLSHGARQINRGPWEHGTQVTTRYYPGRD